MGPSASFELAESVVLGTRHEVFVHRFPHLRALFDDGTTRHAEKPYLVHADRTVTFADARLLVGRGKSDTKPSRRARRGPSAVMKNLLDSADAMPFAED